MASAANSDEVLASSLGSYTEVVALAQRSDIVLAFTEDPKSSKQQKIGAKIDQIFQRMKNDVTAPQIIVNRNKSVENKSPLYQRLPVVNTRMPTSSCSNRTSLRSTASIQKPKKSKSKSLTTAKSNSKTTYGYRREKHDYIREENNYMKEEDNYMREEDAYIANVTSNLNVSNNDSLQSLQSESDSDVSNTKLVLSSCNAQRSGSEYSRSYKDSTSVINWKNKRYKSSEHSMPIEYTRELRALASALSLPNDRSQAGLDMPFRNRNQDGTRVKIGYKHLIKGFSKIKSVLRTRPPIMQKSLKRKNSSDMSRKAFKASYAKAQEDNSEIKTKKTACKNVRYFAADATELQQKRQKSLLIMPVVSAVNFSSHKTAQPQRISSNASLYYFKSAESDADNQNSSSSSESSVSEKSSACTRPDKLSETSVNSAELSQNVSRSNTECQLLPLPKTDSVVKWINEDYEGSKRSVQMPYIAKLKKPRRCSRSQSRTKETAQVKRAAMQQTVATMKPATKPITERQPDKAARKPNNTAEHRRLLPKRLESMPNISKRAEEKEKIHKTNAKSKNTQQLTLQYAHILQKHDAPPNTSIKVLKTLPAEKRTPSNNRNKYSNKNKTYAAEAIAQARVKSVACRRDDKPTAPDNAKKTRQSSKAKTAHTSQRTHEEQRQRHRAPQRTQTEHAQYRFLPANALPSQLQSAMHKRAVAAATKVKNNEKAQATNKYRDYKLPRLGNNKHPLKDARQMAGKGSLTVAEHESLLEMNVQQLLGACSEISANLRRNLSNANKYKHRMRSTVSDYQHEEEEDLHDYKHMQHLSYSAAACDTKTAKRHPPYRSRCRSRCYELPHTANSAAMLWHRDKRRSSSRSRQLKRFERAAQHTEHASHLSACVAESFDELVRYMIIPRHYDLQSFEENLARRREKALKAILSLHEINKKLASSPHKITKYLEQQLASQRQYSNKYQYDDDLSCKSSTNSMASYNSYASDY